MPSHANGTFDVEVNPVPEDASGDRPNFPRLTLDKQFHGDLEGTSQGEMMSVDSGVEGSGAYVAIERVSGTLNGRKGTFTLIHNGTMRRHGDFQMLIKVVPDSGTGELAGLSGTMQIILEEGKHLYDFEYSLPQASNSPSKR